MLEVHFIDIVVDVTPVSWWCDSYDSTYVNHIMIQLLLDNLGFWKYDTSRTSMVLFL